MTTLLPLGVLPWMLLSLGGAADGPTSPQAVSPGEAHRFARIADSCPTFSWSLVPDADRYRLLLFALPGTGMDTTPTLQELRSLQPLLDLELPATTAWTPSLDRCLENRGRYAWFVGARAGTAPEEEEPRWSDVQLFELVGAHDAPSARKEPPARQGLLGDPTCLPSSPKVWSAAHRKNNRGDRATESAPVRQRAAFGTLPSPGPAGISATITNDTGTPVYGIRGEVNGTNPGYYSAGVYGEAGEGQTGYVGIGVAGITKTKSQGFGLYGIATGTGSYGVWGEAVTTYGGGVGVVGRATTGVWGLGSTAVVDQPTYGGYFEGDTGIAVVSTNPSELAGSFQNTMGGLVLAGCPDSSFACDASSPFTVTSNGDLEARIVRANDESTSGATSGVEGKAASPDGRGVHGVATSSTGFSRGVLGETMSTSGRGVFGDARATTGGTVGVVGRVYSAAGVAGLFINTAAGDVLEGQAQGSRVFRVTSTGTVYADGSYNCGLAMGCLNTGQGADVAERIDATEPLRAGEVVEVDPERPGFFRRSRGAYSPRVVGVVSSQPAITMNNNHLASDSPENEVDQRPLLALTGKVPVRVSDENGPIVPGDLLVASSEPGVAMRCDGFERCFGAIIGKALEPHDEGTGQVLMMVLPN